jgi:hypothetical protein
MYVSNISLSPQFITNVVHLSHGIALIEGHLNVMVACAEHLNLVVLFTELLNIKVPSAEQLNMIVLSA